MSGRYARDTSVSVAASRTEVELILSRYGADLFAYATQPGKAEIAFRIRNLQVRMTLPLPLLEQFKMTEVTGRLRSEASQREAYEQACRQRWRALVLVIKAKLEAVEVGISTLDREFLSDTVMPDGSTFHQWAVPQLQRMAESGMMPPLLTEGRS